jgi:hypothetical protein
VKISSGRQADQLSEKERRTGREWITESGKGEESSAENCEVKSSREKQAAKGKGGRRADEWEGKWSVRENEKGCERRIECDRAKGEGRAGQEGIGSRVTGENQSDRDKARDQRGREMGGRKQRRKRPKQGADRKEREGRWPVERRAGRAEKKGWSGR